MRIGIQTWGSLGDIGPFVALANGLQVAGHTVTLQAAPVEPDFDLSALGGSVPAHAIAHPPVTSATQFSQVTAALANEADALKQAQAVVAQLLAPIDQEMYTAAERLCRDSDIVIGHFFAYPLATAAEKAGTPYVSVMPVHSAVPSRHTAPSGLPDLGDWLNPLLWKLVRAMMNKALKPFPDALRATHGLPPAADLIDAVWTSGALNLIAVSPVFCARQDDWDERHHVCGFLTEQKAHASGTPGETLTPELAAFLDAGSPPVYVSFGSIMPSSGAALDETLTLLQDAQRLAGCRMIVQAPASSTSPDLFFLASAPHALVFPRCAAVVHHGGAGTTQTALRAGTPSVVVAHIEEQYFWGQELRRIGAASAPLRRRTLSPRALAGQITAVLNSPRMRQTAHDIAFAMRDEDGVASAVAAIEDRFPH